MIYVIIGVLASVIIFGAIGVSIKKKKISWSFKKKQYIAGIVLLITLVLCVSIVPANHVGVYYDTVKGISSVEEVESGLYCKAPWGIVYTYKTQMQVLEVKDIPRKVSETEYELITVVIQYKISDLQVKSLFYNFKTQGNIKRVLIKPAIYKAVEDNSDIGVELTSLFAGYGIELVSYSVIVEPVVENDTISRVQ